VTRALSVVLLAAIATACAGGEDRDDLSGTLEFPDVEVGSLVGGRVEKVWKREGDEAKAGEVLVTLEAREWEANLEEASALATATARELDLLRAGARAEEIAGAEAEARRLELLWSVSAKGSRPEEVEAARAEVRAVEAALTDAEQEVGRLQTLARGGHEPAATLDRAVTTRDTALARKAVAEQRLRLLERGLRPEEVEAARQAWVAQEERVKALRAGPRPEEVAAKRATLEAAEARIRFAKTKLAELRIVAPGDGFVQTLDVRPGDLVQAGKPVGILLLGEEPWITVHVPEGRLAQVRLGQEASVLPDGHAPVAGRVAWISRRAEYSPRNVQTKGERVTQVFPVRVVLSGDLEGLKDGMWADVRLR
jgi:multidrug resistance efflux pump